MDYSREIEDGSHGKLKKIRENRGNSFYLGAIVWGVLERFRNAKTKSKRNPNARRTKFAQNSHQFPPQRTNRKSGNPTRKHKNLLFFPKSGTISRTKARESGEFEPIFRANARESRESISIPRAKNREIPAGEPHRRFEI